MLPGCNECHGGTGGGGMCPPLTSGVWFWGGDDDTLFRLITLGTQGLEKEGYKRLAAGTVKAPMPPMGNTIKTSDDLWKIIAWIRSINPPGSNPPASQSPTRSDRQSPGSHYDLTAERWRRGRKLRQADAFLCDRPQRYFRAFSVR
jgi:mono/diheme cytochrome c family protein